MNPVARAGRPRAFTLIESVLAIGVVASVLMALVALLPLSLDSVDHSNAQTAHARILQTVAADYRMRDWDTLPVAGAASQPADDLYFDRRGLPVTPTHADRRWVARAILAEPSLPGDTAANTHARRLEIRISGFVYAPDPFSDTDPAITWERSSTLISQFDR